MSAAGVQEAWLETLADCPNYNAWVFDRLAPYLAGPVLEIGSGTGTYTALIAARGLAVTAIEIDPLLAAQARRRLAGRPGVELVEGDAFGQALPPAHYGSVVLLDVLEHVADDAGLLARLAATLRPGGRLLLKVPAGRWLMGPMDRALGHHRRYGAGELRRRLAAAGLTAERLGHMNRVGVLGWWWHARVTGRVTPPQGQVAAFDRLVPLLRRLEALAPLPFGQSLLAVARKP